MENTMSKHSADNNWKMADAIATGKVRVMADNGAPRKLGIPFDPTKKHLCLGCGMMTGQAYAVPDLPEPKTIKFMCAACAIQHYSALIFVIEWERDHPEKPANVIPFSEHANWHDEATKQAKQQAEALVALYRPNRPRPGKEVPVKKAA
jgi:hypothetical protein